ncbi:MAG: CHAT domain-containing protein, partial [Hyphomicrobiaceae bacterium]
PMRSETDPIAFVDRERRRALEFAGRALRRGRNRGLFVAADIVARRAVARARKTGDRRCLIRALDTLGNIQFWRGDRRAENKALRRSEQSFDEALGLLRADDPYALWGPLRHNRTGVYAARHRMDGDAKHVTAAAPHYRAVRRGAWRAGERIHAVRAATNLARMERDAAAAANDSIGLDRAAARLRRLLAMAVRLHALAAEPAREEALEAVDRGRHTLAIALSERAERLYDPDLLKEARALETEAARHWTRQDRPADWTILRNTVGMTHLITGEKEGNPAELHDSLRIFGEIIGRSPGAHLPPLASEAPVWTRAGTREHFTMAAINMSTAWRLLARIEGNPKHLESASRLLEEAQDIFDAGTERLSYGDILLAAGGVECQLGAMKRDRVLWSRGRGRLREAETIFRSFEGVQGHLASTLDALGEAHMLAAVSFSAPQELADAIGCFEGALAIPGAGSHTAQARQTRLALLRARLTEAAETRSPIKVEALRSQIAGSRLRAGAGRRQAEAVSLDILEAEADWTYAAILRDAGFQDVDAVHERLVLRLRTLLENPALDPPMALSCRIALGHILLRRGQAGEAIDIWQGAQKALWQRLAAIEGAGSRRTLVRLAGWRLGAAARVNPLGQGIALGDELALALLDRGRPEDIEQALAAVERGRCTLKALAAVPAQGAAAEPLLRAQNGLREAEAQLRAVEADAPATNMTTAAGAAAAASRRIGEAARRVVDAERRFLDALAAAGHDRIPVPDIGTIAGVVPAGGCLVVLAAGACRSAAIAITPDASLRILPLPTLTRALIDRLVGGLGGSNGSGLADAVGYLAETGADDAKHAIEIKLIEAAPVLWGAAMGPLDAHLRQCGVAPEGDVALMVPGALAALPLHAAADPETGKTFLDHWVVRYSPSLATYVRSHDAAAKDEGAQHNVLRVRSAEEPIARSADPRRTLPARVTFMGRPSIPAAETLQALRDHDIFEFEGHASFQRGDPGRSFLQLAPDSERLILERVRGQPVLFRRLCLLAGCDTATTELSDVIDEPEGLSSEFLELGYAGVLGTTWPVEGGAADTLMALFWDALRSCRRDGRLDPARALRHAQLAFRGNHAMGTADIRLRLAVSDKDNRHMPPSAFYSWAGFRLLGA